MIDKKIFARITKRINSYEDAMIEMQLALTAIPALSPDNGGDGEYEKSRYLIASLHRLGFHSIKEINAPDSRVSSGLRPNIIVNIPGKNLKKTVWILTHMDVVPPGEIKLWNRNPYEGYAKDGKVFGRGTVDNQQDMVASLFAAKAFLDEGIVPEMSIGLAFVSDEETTSQKGLSYMLESDSNPFLKKDLLLIPDSGNEEGTLIEVAEKSILWLRIETRGKQCHGSKPYLGNNAFLAASHLVVRLNDLHQLFGVADFLYDPPESTFQPTKKEANVPNINTIPGEDVFCLDCRVLPMYRLTEVLAQIRNMANEIEKHFGVKIRISPVQQGQAPKPTPHDAPVVLALKESIKEVYKVEAHPAGIGAGTVAAILRRRGYPAAVWSRVTQTAHQPNEHCIIANMQGNAKVYAHLFLQKQ
jgi:succinyl-diaminopimelate desuccinylase